MRLALALLVATGCMQTSSDPPPDPGSGWGSGYGGSGGGYSSWCHVDSDCGSSGYVCARDGECLASTQVRLAHVMWTLQGQVASTTTCSSSPDLELTFLDSSNGGQFGFAPLPCVEGKFTIDKLPTWYTTVELSRQGDYSAGIRGAIAADTGNATVDLPY